VQTLLGLNSGTSADGVDAVVVRFEGDTPRLPLEILASAHMPYPPDLCADLQRLFGEWEGSLERLCHLNFAVGRMFAETAAEALGKAGLRPGEIDVAGSHGQTIFHLPETPEQSTRGLEPSTWQIGEPALIASRIGCPVVSDFRAADIAAGGQGAPLTAVLDHLVFTDPQRARLRLNLGGVANLTWLPAGAESEDVIAFDTGPGNLLINAAVGELTGGAQEFDRSGERAMRGSVDEDLLAELLSEPYFSRSPPKTTGRELFNVGWVSRAKTRSGERGLSDDDFLATLTALTPESVVDAIGNHLPEGSRPDEVILHGGGARNPAIVEGLRTRLPAEVRLCTVEEFGIPLQALEPILFAVLGWKCLRGDAVFYPNATGARRPAVLGKLSVPAP
jgi:anhydro-N-acetylmuramic acid kinase